MSILVNHKLIDKTYLVPSIIDTTAAIAAGATYTVTPLVTPTAGNLLIISAGGTQTRTLTTSPAGFTLLTTMGGGGGGTQALWWKVATGSEPANYSIVWGAILAGGWDIMEIKDTDIISPIDFQIGGNVIAGTSLALTSYNVTRPGLAFTCVSKTLTTNWTSDNGTTNLSGAGEHKRSYKIYSSVINNEIITWSGPSQNVIADLIYIKGRQIGQ